MTILGARPIGFSSFPSSASYLSPSSSSSSRLTSSSLSSTLSMVVECSALQESSTPTATAITNATTPPAEAKEEAKAAKPKAAAKALPELMLEAVKMCIFPPFEQVQKVFPCLSYGSGASTVEPFLVDERKITARHVVFSVEKRLAAQGIIPVWKE